MTSLIRFVKMHGAGNDYVLVSALEDPALVDAGDALAKRVSDRHFGVGGDGLIIVGPSKRADFRQHMWNADGSRGALCGNGLRCTAKLVHDMGATPDTKFTIESDVGVHRTEVRTDARGRTIGARVEIGGVVVEPDAIEIDAVGTTWRVIPGSAGNPHAVVFVSVDPETLDVDRVGAAFQALDRFTGGVNVEFVQACPPDRLVQRTYERGSGETLACGSGATTAACAAIEHGVLSGPRIEVVLRGGTVVVERAAGDRFTLEGPVAESFRGEFRAPSD